MKKQMNKSNENTFVTISSTVLKTNLTPGAKIVLGYIISLSNKTGSCTMRTRTLAANLNIKLRTMQKYLRQIIDHNHVKVGYYKGNRVYTPKFDFFRPENKDAKCIITSDVISNTALTPVYKIAHGLIVARSLNNKYTDAYNWASMKDIAKYMNVSVSTVYRYINKLIASRLLKRHNEARLMFIPLDKYSKERRKEAREIQKQLKKELPDEPRDHIHQPIYASKIKIDPEINAALDKVFNMMK